MQITQKGDVFRAPTVVRDNGWQVKIMDFPNGLQSGFTKSSCYLFFLDIRDTTAHYLKLGWPQRTESSVGKNNIKLEPMLDPRKMLFPPLYLKPGLMKQFVIVLDKEFLALKYLQDCFPKLIAAKVEVGVFIGLQIKKVMK